MKKVMIALFLLAGTVISREAKAQVSVNINIGNQPAWGPTGYDYVDYYYLPDANCYYDVARSQFIYPKGNKWVYGRNLPSRYRGVNLYNTYKVVVNRPNPFRNNQSDIRQYSRYKGIHNQAIIRDSRDSRYYASQQHPQHRQWVKDQNKHHVDNRGRNEQNNRQHNDDNDNRGNKGRGNNTRNQHR